jgi:hypothetical protein
MLAVLAAAAVIGIVARSRTASAEVPSPTLEGPVSGGLGSPFIASTTFDLALVGYQQAEFFISGTASAFTSATPLTRNGMWTVTPGATAAYKTRILVYRPSDPERFNGTVVVEWLNVSGGVEAAPDWISAHTHFIRDGYAWVGVSAQFAGVEGGGGLLGVVELPLKTVDAARYGSLVHPGDSFSYDIFSQTGQAVRRPAGPSPLGDLEIERVIAAGESQSAFRLVMYINGVDPLAQLYDGFMVHSRGGGGPFGAPLSQPPQQLLPAPLVTLIREDVRVPVLTFQTETDLTFLNSFPARQPDTDRIRLWEVAGTAHADTYLAARGATDLGDSPEVANVIITSEPVPGVIMCPQPINSGPQHWVLKAAFAALNRWVKTGRPPAPAPRLEAVGPPVTIMRDAHGNALGGIRTPYVDAPIATYTGEQEAEILCRLFGTTTLFDGATMTSLYRSHRAFVSAFNRATKNAARRGFLLRHDAKLLRQWAAASDIGN